MLYSKTILNICKSSTNCEEVRKKLWEKHVPFEEHKKGEMPVSDPISGKITGRVAFTIDLGKLDRSFYADDYYGYHIIEEYKGPHSGFHYVKLET